MPKVTVIIPNYNHARFLPKRLESVIGQTFRDTEILFLDDASPDNSREVFKRYAADSRVRAIFNETNSGNTFVQWNRGIREAKGEYIWIAESDDFAEETLLAELVNILDRHPNVGLAYCQSRIVDAEGTALPPPELGRDRDRWTNDYVNDGRDECAQYLINANSIPNASAVLLRRSVVERIGPAPEDFKLAGDWMMWARMMMAADMAFIARPLNSFRTHGQTVRNKYWRSPRDLVEIATIKHEIARGLGKRLSRARRIEVAEALAWVWIESLRYQSKPDKFAMQSHRKVLATIAALDHRGIGVIVMQGARHMVRGARMETVVRALLGAFARRRSDSAGVQPPRS